MRETEREVLLRREGTRMRGERGGGGGGSTGRGFRQKRGVLQGEGTQMWGGGGGGGFLGRGGALCQG